MIPRRHKGSLPGAHCGVSEALLKVVVVVGFCSIIAKAFHMQIVDHVRWSERRQAQCETTLPVTHFRGPILDRQGRVLACSVEQLSLFADGRYVEAPRQVATLLAPLVGEDPNVLRKKLGAKRPFIWIKRYLSDQQVKSIEKLGLPGLHLLQEYKRYYPHQRLAGQVLGFVGTDGEGLEGLEKAYDTALRSEPQCLRQYRDGIRRRLWLDSNIVPTTADNPGVRLSLDAFIQHLAERELGKVIEQYDARGGEVVVIDPRTFEVLAMANYPLFDPNSYQKSRAARWRNRAMTDMFEPGSTFKVFLFAAALERGLITENKRMYCEEGKYRFAGHTINDVHPRGWLTASEVVKYSSNICASKVALDLGAEQYHDYIRGFGFGEATGIDLPGEAAGIVRPWTKWRPIDLATSGFGQSIGVTTLQLSRAAACIANGGRCGRPVMVRSLGGERAAEQGRAASNTFYRAIRQETADRVRAMMVTVTEQGGTGVLAGIPGYKVAGKTGTAQVVDRETGRYSKKEYTSVFVGFVPAENPRLAMAVVVHGPRKANYGGVVAAPVFRNIGAEALPYLGVFPAEKPPVLPVRFARLEVPGARDDAAPARTAELETASAGRMPDVRGLSLRLALQQLAPFQVKWKTRGSGKVIRQKPAAGTRLKRNAVVELALKDR